MNEWISREQLKAAGQPVLSAEEAYKRNLDIGQVRGYLAVLQLPRTLLAIDNDTINQLSKEAEYERGRDNYEGHPVN